MNFSEKQLVDLFVEHGCLNTFRPCHKREFPRSKWYLKRRDILREYQLDSEKRIDIFVTDKSRRVFWVIEAKIVAGPDAIFQALEYLAEVVSSEVKYRHNYQKVSIIAQFFKEETLTFARALGVECIQIVPINQERARFYYLNSPTREEVLRLSKSYWGWLHGQALY